MIIIVIIITACCFLKQMGSEFAVRSFRQYHICGRTESVSQSLWNGNTHNAESRHFCGVFVPICPPNRFECNVKKKNNKKKTAKIFHQKFCASTSESNAENELKIKSHKQHSKSRFRIRTRSASASVFSWYVQITANADLILFVVHCSFWSLHTIRTTFFLRFFFLSGFALFNLMCVWYGHESWLFIMWW